MKKVFYVIGGLLLLLIAAVFITPILFKGKIVELVKKTANENVNAKINFDNDITLSLISNFPDFTLGIKELSVVGINEFEGDTLVYLKEFSATLDIMSVINGEQIKIRKVLLDGPYINAIVTKDGKANWDIAKPSTDTTTEKPADTTASKFNIALKKFEIKNAEIKYNDNKGGTFAHLKNLNYTLNGDFSQDQVELVMDLGIDETSVAQAGVKYLNKVKTTFKAGIDADNKNAKYTFRENEISLNELTFKFDGFVQMIKDDINLDLKYAATKTDFKNFLSLVPGVYTKDFKDVQTTGKLGFNGFAKGTYNSNQLPAFAFNLLVENAMFKYPSLPAPVNNINIKLAVTNPDGNIDHTKIDLSTFHFEVSGDPFDAKLIAVNPVKDPEIDASFVGRLNFDNLTKIVPLEEGMKISGLLTTDLQAKGKVSTIEKGQYEDFNASGNLAVTNLMFVSKALPQSFNLSKTELRFNPKTVTLASFDAKLGKSDMQMSGELSNFFSYIFGKGTLKGVLNFNSLLIDANQFISDKPQPEQSPAQVDTASISAPEIPANIEFTLNSNIAKLLYTNMEISNFKGQVKVAEQKLAFNKIALNTLGAAITMDGYYETSNPKKPSVIMDFGIQNLDIQKAFATFNTVKKIAPIAEKTKGSMSTTFKMNAVLDQKLNPIYDELFAEGVLTVPSADIQGVKVFEKVGEVLKNEAIKKPTLSNVRIQFKVENGKIYTKPFDMNIAGQKMTLSGTTGLDQTIDYLGTSSIPRKDLGAVNSALEQMLASANKKAGTNVALSGNINVGLKIGGTFTNPSVSTNLADIAKNEASSIKDQLSAELDKKKKELEAKARAEAEKLKAQGEKAKKEAEAKARAEADRLKAEADKVRREAEEKAKAEQEKAKKKAEEEAKKKLKGLFPR